MREHPAGKRSSNRHRPPTICVSTKSEVEIKGKLTKSAKIAGGRRTLLPWMGGKSRLAARIIPLLPEHTTYVEPFCGGCAVFFQKPRSAVEIINDADNRLITLLRVFRYHPDELLRELECITHSRQDFRDALAQPGITDIQRAARFLLVVKAGFGAKVSSPTFGYSRTARANFTQAAIADLVAAARVRLEGVTIENLDFADVIGRYDSPGTLFYCDPPYIGTAGYACRFTMDDHTRLRDALAGIKGAAVVSLNDCQETRRLYNGWEIRELEVAYSVGGKGADRKRRNGEVMIFR